MNHSTKFVNQLEGFRKTVSVGGKVVGEIDVELKNSIIEVTGGAARGKVAQAQELLSNSALNPSGKSVIVFGTDLSNRMLNYRVLTELRLIHDVSAHDFEIQMWISSSDQLGSSPFLARRNARAAVSTIIRQSHPSDSSCAPGCTQPPRK
jgi:hypothetical protein